MSSVTAQTIFTPEEYLTLERKATVKSEYLNGEIRAMPRVNFVHNFITVDIAQEYILVSQDRVRVEQHRLIKTQWVQTEFRESEDVLPLASIACELLLLDIYRRVAFSEGLS